MIYFYILLAPALWVFMALVMLIVSCCMCRKSMPEDSLIACFGWCLLIWPLILMDVLIDLLSSKPKDPYL